MNISPTPRRFHLQKGFSLMELAVVLMIIGTLLGGVLVAVTQTRESNLRTNALAQLRQIEDALYGYTQTMSQLPCPDINGDGIEDRTVGVCTAYIGFVPYASLGLYSDINTDGLMIDPWFNPYRYIVEDTDTFTVRANLAALFNSPNPVLDPMITVDCSATEERAQSACQAGQTIASSIPALVLSMGANWADCGSTIVEEESNGCEPTGALLGYPMPTDATFIKAGYSQELYDDQMIWLSPYTLFNRLVAAGKLP